ncbi:MAG: VCBS repeat-containing protein [Alphaproteobacteria bacterium]|nr:VCBS repeat-containing protein [Alphaproteobacteria bacterium]MCB9792248.1 VCBS repeat-containing protein [Alphaproteobacteria bacterium]
MFSRLPLILLTTLFACTKGGDRPGIFGGDDTDAGDDTGGPTAACLGYGFGQSPVTWSLPAVASWDDWMDSTFESTSGECARSSFTAVLMDLNGDGRSDLVVTDDCDQQGLGHDHWDLYTNTGSGFSASPTTWSLPAAASWDDWMDNVSESSSSECNRSSFTAQLVDMNGDAKPDLVITDDCDPQGVGDDHWDVYTNTGSGFAPTPTTWSLPAAASWDDWMDNIAESNSGDCNRSSFTAQLMDLNGDAKPDLVVTDDCDQQGVGHDNWEVYTNTGSGFAPSPTSWSLPAPLTNEDDWMDSVAESTSSPCSRSSFTAQLVDMNGDAKPDLVVTDNCDQQGLGHERWDVYTNTGSGFAASPTAWPLPSPLTSEDDWMDNVAESTSSPCSRSSFTAFLADYEGDGKPDIVVTDSCDVQGLGHDSWAIYKNTGSGFQSSPMEWTLPTPPQSEDDWLQTSYVSTSDPCARSSFTAGVIELDGEPGPDIVIFDDCDQQGVGHDNWTLYPGTCSR